jgi:trimethyllysine dioxygenase|tara:strand:+ start:477 stop:731 length:255 start_codon:yes stop_codon:yes gene_type:complete
MEVKLKSEPEYEMLDAALNKFEKILDQNKVNFKLEEGEAVLVHNHRVLHGRESWEGADRDRELLGCYIGAGEVMSRWRVENLVE